jgi:hypothetical protein
VIGLDPDLDPFVSLIASRLGAETEAMASALAKAGALENATYKAAPGKTDAVADGRAILRRFALYVESRPDGDALAEKVLQGESLTTVLRRRPVKLAAALDHALSVLAQHKADLPEHESWAKALTASRDALASLNENVRKSRADRAQMTPEVAAARASWLRRYAGTKSIINGILKPLEKTSLLPSIFDDLAETHRATGVSDDDAPDNAGETAGLDEA